MDFDLFLPHTHKHFNEINTRVTHQQRVLYTNQLTSSDKKMNDESDIQNILFPVIRDKFEFRKSEALEDLNISKFQEVGRLNFDETDENRDERVRQVWPVTQFFCFFLFCKNNH